MSPSCRCYYAFVSVLLLLACATGCMPPNRKISAANTDEVTKALPHFCYSGKYRAPLSAKGIALIRKIASEPPMPAEEDPGSLWYPTGWFVCGCRPYFINGKAIFNQSGIQMWVWHSEAVAAMQRFRPPKGMSDQETAQEMVRIFESYAK